jgi:hypothetical protein
LVDPNLFPSDTDERKALPGQSKLQMCRALRDRDPRGGSEQLQLARALQLFVLGLPAIAHGEPGLPAASSVKTPVDPINLDPDIHALRALLRACPGRKDYQQEKAPEKSDGGELGTARARGNSAEICIPRGSSAA